VETIEKMFKTSTKASTEQSLIDVQDVLLGNSEYGSGKDLTPSQIEEIVAPVENTKDKLKAREDLYELKKGPSNSRQKANNITAAKMLKTQLYNEGMIEDSWGNLDDDSKEIWRKSQTELISYLRYLPENTPPADINDYVKKFVAQLKPSKVFRRSNPRAIEPIPDPNMSKGDKQKKTKDYINSLDSEESVNLQKRFKREAPNGYFTKIDDPKFEQWVWKINNGKFRK